MNETLTPQIEVQPIEQAPLPAAKPPKFVKVTITEEDRQNAREFTNCEGCLIWDAGCPEASKLETTIGSQNLTMIHK